MPLLARKKKKVQVKVPREGVLLSRELRAAILPLLLVESPFGVTGTPGLSLTMLSRVVLSAAAAGEGSGAVRATAEREGAGVRRVGEGERCLGPD